jgi:hypothetical protein
VVTCFISFYESMVYGLFSNSVLSGDVSRTQFPLFSLSCDI